MARARIIKHGFFLNDLLAEVEPLGRLLFAGLWCDADRSGRLEDRPKRIKAEILPYDDCDVDDLLNQLAERGFIMRYKANGTSYIQITNFEKHQSPHIREAESAIPGPDIYPEINQYVAQAPDKHGASTRQAPDQHDTGTVKGSLDPDPIYRSKEGISAKKSNTAFNAFKEAYPWQENMAEAEKVWKAKKLDRAPMLARTIIEDVKRRKVEHGQWLDGFIPHATKYLRNERWRDAITPPKEGSNGHGLNGKEHKPPSPPLFQGGKFVEQRH